MAGSSRRKWLLNLLVASVALAMAAFVFLNTNRGHNRAWSLLAGHRGPLSEACRGGPCLTFEVQRQTYLAALQHGAGQCARNRYAEGSCWRGGHYLVLYGGTMASTRYYDANGAMVGEEGTNDVGSTWLYGDDLHCSDSDRRDLCDSVTPPDGGR